MATQQKLTVVTTCAIWLALAIPTAAAEREPLPAGAFQAGYRITSLTYVPPGSELEAAVTRKVFLWYPTREKAEDFNYLGQKGLAAKEAQVAEGSHPVILFSHGFLGTGDQTIFLLEELARQGYIVAAPNHTDSLATKRTQRLEQPRFADAASWTDEKFRDRGRDISALLDQLLKDDKDRESPFYGHIDDKRVGVLGHSLGGYTAFSLVGAWPSWRDERIRAACLLSPYIVPFLDDEELGKQIQVPVMMQGGTLDLGITPFLNPLYDKLQSPRYHLVLKNETHFGWTNLIALGQTTTAAIEKGNCRWITAYTVAFFQQHLRGKDQPLLKEDNAELFRYRQAER